MATDVGAGRTVGVVEDNERNARLVCDVLAAHGFSILTWGTGEQAVAEIPDTAVDLVLVDIELPGIGGIEVRRRLRAAGVAVPMVAVTAYAMKGDRERFLTAGFDGYLAKPLDVAGLADAVAEILDQGAPRP